jgi:hypothetical protein
MPKTTNATQELVMLKRPPIWEPDDSGFRPYSLNTLILFYLGRVFGRLFGRRPQGR